MLTFGDTGNLFELMGGFLKMIIYKNYNDDLASFSVEKLMYEFAKETNFDVKARGKKSKRDRTLINL